MVQFKHSNLESAAEAAGGGGKAFTAGTLGQLPPSPRISFDGTTLWLDAARLDAVGGMIIDSRYCLDYHKLLGLDPLLRLLRNVAGMTHVYPLGDGTSFDAVTTALASSLSSSTTKIQISLWMKVQTNLRCYCHQRSARAFGFVSLLTAKCATGRHTCKALERSIEETDTDTETQQEVKEEVKEKVEKRRKLDSLIYVYWQLVNKFPSLPWSRTADQGGAALHEGREAPGNPNTVIGRLINMVDYYEWTEDIEFEISELVTAQLKRIQPISPRGAAIRERLPLRSMLAELVFHE